MKIVFIPVLPYTYRDHLRFGVKFFIDKGFNVNVYDVHKILYPGYKERVKIDYWTFEDHYEIQDLDDLLTKIKKLTDKDYIFFYIAGRYGRQLLAEMQNITDAKFITYFGGAMPATLNPHGLKNKSILFLKRIYKKFFMKKKFVTDYFVAGSKTDETAFNEIIGKDTKVVKSHSQDYNLCLQAKEFLNDKPYCVFLDTDAIDASDYHLFKNRKTRNVEEYLQKITLFFQWLENEFNIEVIIASHPKSRIFHKQTHFNGFKVIENKSAELVKSAKFVVNEGTTAISYAVFFKKPLIFFTCEELSFFKHTFSFAKEMNKEIIQIDKLDKSTKDKFKKELNNSNSYHLYKEKYLTYLDDHKLTFEKIEMLFLGK